MIRIIPAPARMKFHLRVSLLFTAFLLVSGCAGSLDGSRYFRDDQTNLELLRRVAVLPFVNHTQTKLVENRFTNIVTTEILCRGLFEVAAPGDVLAFLKDEVRGDPAAVDARVARKLGRALKVDAYLTGAVEIYDMEHNGTYNYPVIAVTMQLIDIKSGRIIWQAAGSDTGYDSWSRIFGLASDDFNLVSFRLARQLLDTLQMEPAE